ncbi:MAG: hypothetical protein AAF738_10705, partial [Bacteroidota bacterium]
VDDIDCVQAFAIDRFSSYGISPYNLSHQYERLVEAFRTKDYRRILRFSTDLGHYLADAHVPLHTTLNYDGTTDAQKGIHAFWETRLPELFAEADYDFFVGKAEYIYDTNNYFWDIILESHQLVDAVLLTEEHLRLNYPNDQQFCHEARGSKTIRTTCTAYATAYHEALDGMVEKRMRASIKALGNVWLSAWVDAGQPLLESIDASILKPQKKEKQVPQNTDEGTHH